MLYSTDYIADIEEIYESYVKGGGRELICMAYLSYFADAWLVRNMVVPEAFTGMNTKKSAGKASSTV